ncbi:MATE family efflux transporter [Croceibacterium aestuarii]|uniref:MATE family efflux transporter n=1 Tax=Croceibacterium aestuarii TaxID=3064139 RepID=UPI00272EC84D|nr:MATE family efflux transporter [Croceibacterium sp. D39]
MNDRPASLSRRAVFAQAWPIMLGQASIPFVGLVDTAAIGRTGNAAALAGVALGATVISLVFWTFGFLRMGMTGLTAQAGGAGRKSEVDALLVRGLAVGAAIGVALLALLWPLRELAFALFAGGAETTSEARAYVTMRFFGAPAALAVFAVTGWLFGLGRTRAALVLQLVMNLANAVFDIAFVFGLGMGASGVGLGTALAEWVALATGLVIVTRIAGAGPVALARRAGSEELLERSALAHLFAVNRDLMVRTIALLMLFAWFANAGARLGAVALAAQHVLMQFVNVAAFVLDAFAFTAEARVGAAIGAKSRPRFLRAVRLTSEFSLASAVLLALAFWLAGDWIIALIATEPAVRTTAERFLPYAALVPLIGLPSWMLDGIYIGATRGRALRNAAIAATALYIATDLLLRPLGAQGVWLALWAAYGFRAAGLALQLPALVSGLDTARAVEGEAKGG